MDQSSIFSLPPFDDSQPPIPQDSIGSFQCEVVKSILLRDIYTSAWVTCEANQPSVLSETGEQGVEANSSELFICRVVKVIPGTGKGSDQPLLYWRQKYTSVVDKG